MTSIPGNFAITRSDTGHVFDVVKSAHQIGSNANILRFFEPLVGFGTMNLVGLGSTYGGKRVFGVFSIDANPLSPEALFSPLLFITARHDGQESPRVFIAGSDRNTNSILNFHGDEVHRWPRHAVNLNHTAGTGPVFEKAKFVLDAMKRAALKMSKDRRPNPTAFMRTVYVQRGNGVLRAENELVSSAEALSQTHNGGAGHVTAWDCFRAVCFYEDHKNYPSDSKDRRAEQAMFGIGANVKRRAFKLAA